MKLTAITFINFTGLQVTNLTSFKQSENKMPFKVNILPDTIT